MAHYTPLPYFPIWTLQQENIKSYNCIKLAPQWAIHRQGNEANTIYILRSYEQHFNSRGQMLHSSHMLLPSRKEPVEAEMRSDKRCSRNRGKKLLLKWQWNTCGWIKRYASITASFKICNQEETKSYNHGSRNNIYLYQIHWNKPHKIFVAGELLQILAKSDGLLSLSKRSLANRQSERNGMREGGTVVSIEKAISICCAHKEKLIGDWDRSAIWEAFSHVFGYEADLSLFFSKLLTL